MPEQPAPVTPLRIAVCMKQVPNVARIRFDPDTRRVVREGVAGLMDTFENRALTFALAYKDGHAAHVTALTMGPSQAAEIIVQALASGADEGLHLCDPAFAGADTLATARALSLALRDRAIDLVLCGRHSTDSETGQIGPELAELLGIPHLTGVSRLSVDAGARAITAERETDDGIAVMSCPLPALVTVAEEIADESWPRPDEIGAIDPGRVVTLDAAALGGDPATLGAAGSPTWVGEVYAEETARLHEVLQDAEPAELARRLVEALLAKDALRRPRPEAGIRAVSRPVPRGEAVWACVSHGGGRLRRVSFELLGAAARIADAIAGHTAAVLLGGSAAMAEELARYGADEVLSAVAVSPGGYDMERHAAVLTNAIAAEQPFAVLLPADADGRDLAPRVAARLGLGLTGDCIDLRIDPDGALAMLKPAFGGNIIAPVYSRTRPALATVRPGLLTLPAPNPALAPCVRALPVPEVETRLRLERFLSDNSAGADTLAQARVVIGAGRGLGSADNLAALQPLAAVLHAEIGATRGVTDLGWLPRRLQIGLTGRAVAPAVYLAVGISGSFNHMVGVLKAGTIVAINRSPRAAITRAADYTLLGEWERLVPALVAELERAVAAGRLRL